MQAYLVDEPYRVCGHQINVMVPLNKKACLIDK